MERATLRENVKKRRWVYYLYMYNCTTTIFQLPLSLIKTKPCCTIPIASVFRYSVIGRFLQVLLNKSRFKNKFLESEKCKHIVYIFGYITNIQLNIIFICNSTWTWIHSITSHFKHGFMYILHKEHYIHKKHGYMHNITA